MEKWEMDLLDKEGSPENENNLGSIMRTITLWQPWATLMAFDEKQYETRGFRLLCPAGTLIAVHAALKFPNEAKTLCLQEPFKSALERCGYPDWRTLPTGAIVSLHHFEYCISTNDWPKEQAKMKLQEMSFGDYSDGRYAWRMPVYARPLHPVLCKGKQGIWNYSENKNPINDFTVIIRGDFD
jgi:hypothetical protein